MTRIAVKVMDSANTFIAHVPRRKQVQWQDAHNDVGSGSFLVHADDQILTDHPTLLDNNNIVVLSKAGSAFFAFLIESKRLVNLPSGEKAERLWEVSGRGVLALLGRATVYPEYGVRVDSAPQRSFDFGSKDGSWRVTSEWAAPLGIRQDSATGIRKGYPLKWPDPGAMWIWPTNPETATPAGPAYFRSTFTTTAAATTIRLFAAGDDGMVLQLDGEPVIETHFGEWRKLTSYQASVGPGVHTIAAQVNAVLYNGATNPAGFICAVYKVDRNGKLVQRLRHTSLTEFICRPTLTAPPGWFAASILRKLVLEAQARVVQGLSAVTMDFTDTLDTASASWTGRHDRFFDVGTDSLLDVLARLTELDIDVAMSPTLVLHAWKERGTDRTTGTAPIILRARRDLTGAEIQSDASGLRTRLLVQHRKGWGIVVDTTAEATYGRLEGAAIVGTAASDSQAQRVGLAALNDINNPQITYPLECTSEKGPQPYTDFFLADTVKAAGSAGTPGKARIMTISGAEDDNTGVIRYSLEGYPA